MGELEVVHIIDKETPTRLDIEWNKKQRIAKNTIKEYQSNSLLGLTSKENTAWQIFLKLSSIYKRTRIVSDSITFAEKIVEI